jgi:hypothetical protein
MRLFHIVSLSIALVLAGTAAAQMPNIQAVRPPAVNALKVNPQATQAPTATQMNYQDPEQMKAQIARLKREKRAMRVQLQTTLADLQAARSQIDEMTREGGSLVTARCVAPELSRNTAGAEENCAASGYACEKVSGLCRRMCNVTTDCAGGFICDTGAGRCVPPPPPADDE